MDDPYDDINKVVDESEGRLLDLESTDDSLTNKNDFSQLRWKTQVDEYHKIIRTMKEENDMNQKDFRDDVEYFLGMVERFKGCATKEDFNRLHKIIHSNNYETLVTQLEYRKMVLDKLKEFLS